MRAAVCAYMPLRVAHAATRLPAQDLERARRFYADKLGLEPVEERPGRLLYRCSGDTFAPFESTGSSPDTFTQIGFTVEDLDATIAELAARGLAFAEDFGTVAMAGAVMALRSAHAWVL